MAKYEVKSVVSDYGLYVNGELKLICSHRKKCTTYQVYYGKR